MTQRYRIATNWRALQELWNARFNLKIDARVVRKGREVGSGSLRHSNPGTDASPSRGFWCDQGFHDLAGVSAQSRSRSR
jgi:hypothetical protein